MDRDIWFDGGRLNRLFQESIKDAFKWYIPNGYLDITEDLEIEFEPDEPLGSVRKTKTLEDALTDCLDMYTTKDETVLEATFEGCDKRENLIKLQQCLRILKGA